MHVYGPPHGWRVLLRAARHPAAPLRSPCHAPAQLRGLVAAGRGVQPARRGRDIGQQPWLGASTTPCPVVPLRRRDRSRRGCWSPQGRAPACYWASPPAWHIEQGSVGVVAAGSGARSVVCRLPARASLAATAFPSSHLNNAQEDPQAPAALAGEGGRGRARLRRPGLLPRRISWVLNSFGGVCDQKIGGRRLAPAVKAGLGSGSPLSETVPHPRINPSRVSLLGNL